MGREVLIQAAGLTKTYRFRGNPLAHMANLLAAGSAKGGRPALVDVGLALERGEALGVVGRNGAGKSTLLQILCGTQTPDIGTVRRVGRIAAMLELGAGFDPRFTGRENARLNASVHGLSDRQIEERLPLIEAFADIGGFIDRPVAEYSSGMRVRLAFAVCAHVDADVLIVDEVLGVGDWAFQAKCRAFIEKFLTRGALVFVSHDEQAVMSVCNRAMWLDQGRVVAAGPSDAVLRRYREAMSREEASPPASADAIALPEPVASPLEENEVALTDNPIDVVSCAAEAPSHGHGGAVIDDVYLSDASGTRLARCHGGRSVVLNIVGHATREVERPIVGFIWRDEQGQNLFGDNTSIAYRDRPQRLAPGGRFHAQLQFRLPLLPKGIYTVAPSVIDGTQQSHVHLHWLEDALVLTVPESPVSAGLIGVPMRVSVRTRNKGPSRPAEDPVLGASEGRAPSGDQTLPAEKCSPPG